MESGGREQQEREAFIVFTVVVAIGVVAALGLAYGAYLCVKCACKCVIFACKWIISRISSHPYLSVFILCLPGLMYFPDFIMASGGRKYEVSELWKGPAVFSGAVAAFGLVAFSVAVALGVAAACICKCVKCAYNLIMGAPPERRISSSQYVWQGYTESEDQERPHSDPLGGIRFLSLHDRLQVYYKDHVDFPSWKMEEAKKVVDVVKNHFRDHVKRYGDEEVEFLDTGSTTEGLKVIKPDEFDVMLVVDGKQNFRRNGYGYEIEEPTHLPDADGFYFVRRRRSWITVEALYKAKKWTDPGSKCIEDELFSPKEVRRSFKSMMDQAFSNFNQYQVQPCKEQGPSVMLKVTYISHGQKKSLSIDFVPAYKFDNRVVVAKPHPKYFPQSPVSKDYENLWRVSYSRQEMNEVTQNAGQRGCKLQCLKILKAVRVYHHAELGALSSYTLKTTWLHMVKENQGKWKEDLSKYFTDLVKRLEEHLRHGHLQHYFNPSVNILSPLSASERMHSANYLRKVINKGTYEHLLNVPPQ